MRVAGMVDSKPNGYTCNERAAPPMEAGGVAHALRDRDLDRAQSVVSSTCRALTLYNLVSPCRKVNPNRPNLTP